MAHGSAHLEEGKTLAHGSTYVEEGKDGQPTIEDSLMVDGNMSLEARRMTRLVSFTQYICFNFK